MDCKGDKWVADRDNNRVEEFGPAGEYLQAFPIKGTLKTAAKPAGIALTCSDEWVLLAGEDVLQEYNEKGELLKEVGKPGQGNGEFAEPEGLTITSHGHILVADTGNARVQEFTETGEFIKAFSMPKEVGGRPYGIAVDPHGHIWTSNSPTIKAAPVTEFSESGELLKTVGVGVESLTAPAAIAIDSRGDVFVEDLAKGSVLEFNEAGTYETAFGSSGSGTGQFKFISAAEGAGIAVDANHDVFVSDPGNDRVERWLAPSLAAGNSGAHTTQTIYYSTGANSSYPSCGNHAEWAGLPCLERHAAQPEASGIPSLPETTYTYNIWEEPLTTTDKAGSIERTTTLTYDPAGRPMTSSITSNSKEDASLPAVSDEYSPTSGLTDRQSTTSEGKTKSLVSEDNTLGQLVSYTDALETTTKYEYEKEGDDRLTQLTVDTGGPAEATDTYGYNTTTGVLETVKDASANNGFSPSTFTATRDIEGNITSETYSNGITAKYTLNQVGERTGLEYVEPAAPVAARCPIAIASSPRSTANGARRPRPSQARATAMTKPARSPKSKPLPAKAARPASTPTKKTATARA